MKQKSSPPSQVHVPCPLADFDDDDDDFKDVFWPNFDMLPGETPVTFRLRFAFVCDGYRAIKVEEVQTHPIVIIRAVQPDAGRIVDHRLLLRHVQDMLCRAGFRPKRDELMVAPSGHRVLIAFQTGKWAPNFEEILREPQADMADYAEMAL